MNDLKWAGGSILYGSDGARSSWGDGLAGIPVVDPPLSLSALSGGNVDPLKMWKTQPSLRKVISFAARNIASVPLHIYVRDEDKGRDRDRDSKAAELFKNPAPFVSMSRLISNLVVDQMLYDRWMVIYMDGQLVRVPAELIETKTNMLGQLTNLGIRSKAGLVDVTDLTVAYDAGWAANSADGVSPLRTLDSTLEEQRRAIQSRNEQWENAARVSGILTYPKNLVGEARTRFLESWKGFREGKAGGDPLLENGMDYKQLTRPKLVDTQDLEGRRLTDVEVASFYHIPPELVGSRPGTFSNIAAFRAMLFGPVLGPVLTSIESAFNERIIPALAPAGAYAEFNRESAMAGSFAEQAAYLQKAVGGPYMTVAEARDLQNLPFLDDTEDLIVPMNVTHGGLASPADTDSSDSEKSWLDPEREYRGHT